MGPEMTAARARALMARVQLSCLEMAEVREIVLAWAREQETVDAGAASVTELRSFVAALRDDLARWAASADDTLRLVRARNPRSDGAAGPAGEKSEGRDDPA